MVASPERVQVELTDPQFRLLVELEDVKTVLFCGGVGCSKTRALAYGVARAAVSYPNGYIGVAAGTYPQLHRSTIREVLTTLEELRIEHEYMKGHREVVFPNGSVIPFLTCDVQDPSKLRGPSFSELHVDECESTEEPYVARLMERVRLPDKGGVKYPRRLRFYTNPAGSEHWTTRWFYSNPIPGYQLVQASTYDNNYLSSDVITQMEQLYPPGTVEHRRNMLGEMGVPIEGAVYPEFGDHCMMDAGEVDAFARAHGGIAGYAGGLDFGARHAFVFLSYALTADDHAIFIGEHYARDTVLADHARGIHGVYRGGPIFADHDAQGRIELEREHGVVTSPAPKHIGVLDGIHCVRRRIRDGRLKVVTGACPNLCRELRLYRWAEGLREVPYKKDDDACDAMRYALTGIDYAFEHDNAALLSRMFQSA